MLHQIIHYLNKMQEKTFRKGSKHLEKTQRDILKEQTFKSKEFDRKVDYEEFKTLKEIVDYSDLRQEIEKKRESFCHDHIRFQSTSGSTDKVKLIPYNKKILNEFDWASSPWISNLYEKFPGIKSGKHFWSLSWVPESLRKINQSDDSELLPLHKRIIMEQMMLPDPKIAYLESNEDAMFATIFSLVESEDLTLISVWSPTFLLNLVDLIIEKSDLIMSCHDKSSWLPYGKSLSIKFPKKRSDLSFFKYSKNMDQQTLVKKLWPNLCLVSAWDTSTSKVYADKVKNIFSHASFQGKGLWSTEAVVTIPFDNKFPLAYKSHFYEFEIVETSQIIPSWELKIGMLVKPIVSTGNEFFRYKINDILYVNDFFNDVPCFEFMGHENTVDLVGEKIDSKMVNDLFSDVGEFCLLAINKTEQKPYYYFLTSEQNISDDEVENRLSTIYHYNLARELGQLNHCVSRSVDDLTVVNNKMANLEEGIIGNNKVEILQLVKDKNVIKYLESI